MVTVVHELTRTGSLVRTRHLPALRGSQILPPMALAQSAWSRYTKMTRPQFPQPLTRVGQYFLIFLIHSFFNLPSLVNFSFAHQQVYFLVILTFFTPQAKGQGRDLKNVHFLLEAQFDHCKMLHGLFQKSFPFSFFFQGREKNVHFFAGGVVRPLQNVPRPLPKMSVVGRRKEPLPSLPNSKSRTR